MTEQTLNITITDSPDGLNVLYNYDALPPHDARGPFASIEAAKASVAEELGGEIDWQEPDEECAGDVISIAVRQ